MASDPENVPALTKLGVLSTANGQFETAEAIYRQVLILAPGDVGVLTILANFAVNRIAIGEAQDSFRQALARHPNHWQASLGLGGLLVDLGRTVEAVPILRDAIAARTSERADAPGLLDARALLAEILVTVGCDDEAQTLAQAVLAKEPDHCQALCALGDLLAESGQVELAEQAFTFAANTNPKTAAPLVRLAVLYDTQERIGDGAKTFSRAIEADPEDAEALRYFAGHLVGLGLEAEAQTAFEASWRLKPTKVSTALHLADLHTGHGHHALALEYLVAARTLRPEKPEFGQSLAACLIRLGCHDRAREVLAGDVGPGAASADRRSGSLPGH